MAIIVAGEVRVANVIFQSSNWTVEENIMQEAYREPHFWSEKRKMKKKTKLQQAALMGLSPLFGPLPRHLTPFLQHVPALWSETWRWHQSRNTAAFCFGSAGGAIGLSLDCCPLFSSISLHCQEVKNSPCVCGQFIYMWGENYVCWLLRYFLSAYTIAVSSWSSII